MSRDSLIPKITLINKKEEPISQLFILRALKNQIVS